MHAWATTGECLRSAGGVAARWFFGCFGGLAMGWHVTADRGGGVIAVSPSAKKAGLFCSDGIESFVGADQQSAGFGVGDGGGVEDGTVSEVAGGEQVEFG